MAAHTNPTYSKFDFTKPCSRCAYENEMIARKIDQCGFQSRSENEGSSFNFISDSRIIFPTAFIIFCIAYWLYYGWWDASQ